MTHPMVKNEALLNHWNRARRRALVWYGIAWSSYHALATEARWLR
jgi:hypothetical protein